MASKSPPLFARHIKDTEKRLNFLYDLLNNGELLQPDTIVKLRQLAEMLQAKEYDEAHRLQVEIQKEKTNECETWMVSLTRVVGVQTAVFY